MRTPLAAGQSYHPRLRSLTQLALLAGCCLSTLKSGLAARPGQPVAESSGAARRATAAGAHTPPGGSFLIHNVRIFDGTSVIGANSVLVRDGKIAKLGENLTAPKDVPIVDGTGDTLLPGLFDAHVHSFERAALQQELLFGVTTELDMNDPPAFATPIQRAQAAGKERDLADIFTAGWCATCPGGHGTEEASLKVPTLSGPEQAQEFVAARLAEGSNYIKIIYDDGSEFGRHTPTISKETMAALVRAAHQRGKLAVAHVFSYQGARDAIQAGVDGLAHLFGDCAPGPDFGRACAAHHMFVIGTLTILDTARGASGASLTTDAHLAPYLAMRATQALRPGHTDAEYLTATPAWLDECNKRRGEILAEIEPCLADARSETMARFTVDKGATGIGREAYYAGWLVVERLTKRGMTLAQIAHIPQKEILRVVSAAVRELRAASQAG